MSEMYGLDIRVYYEDTDAGGVVYNARYLNFYERCRTEWLRKLGVEQDILRAEAGILFAVTRAEVDFIRPARFNHLLRVSVKQLELRRASLVFQQQILHQDTLVSRANIRVACIAADSFRPAGIPENMRNVIKNAI